MIPRFLNGVVPFSRIIDVKRGLFPRSGSFPARFQGETVAEAYHLCGEAVHIPSYPVYTDCAVGLANDFPYFYNRSSTFLKCQASRFTLVGGQQLLTLIEQDVLDPLRDLSSYWNGYYWEHFAHQVGFVIHYERADGYRDFIQQHPDYKVISAHPFDTRHVPSHQFYLENPALIIRLNNKGRMHELSRHAIPSRVYTPEQFHRELWRDEWSLPLVVKLTEPSGGGDGVVICKDESAVAYAKQVLAGREVKIEPYIQDVKNNYNVNVNVAPDGEITFVGVSLQKTGGAGEYGGNYIDLKCRPSRSLWKICVEIAQKAYALGWYGMCGLDIIETEGREFFFIDPNFRLNGSTPIYLMRRFFEAHFNAPIIETGYFRFAGEPVDFLNRFKKEIERKVFTPIGFYCPTNSPRITYSYAALVTDGDLDDYAALKRTLIRKQLILGLGMRS